MGIKALATAILQGNQRRNQRETQSFLANKPGKPKRVGRKLPTTEDHLQWQHDFCIAHAEFNHWRGCCHCSIGDCTISRVIDSGGDIDKLRGLEIGEGITTDMVIDEWLNTGEPAKDLFRNPTWLICMAESIKRNNI